MSAPQRVVPAQARQAAARLSALFGRDRELVLALNDAAQRLRSANGELWDGLHPDALGLLYDERAPAAGLAPEFVHRSRVLLHMADPVDHTRVLERLQGIHWRIQSAFCDYQRIADERRQLAVDVGEATAQLVAAMTAAGFTDSEARTADVHELAHRVDRPKGEHQ